MKKPSLSKVAVVALIGTLAGVILVTRSSSAPHPLPAATVQTLTGDAPKKMPVWEPGGDIKEYSEQTLLFLKAAAEKMGHPTQEISLSFRGYDAVDNKGCMQYSSAPVVYCEVIGGGDEGFEVDATSEDWQVADFERSLHPFHMFTLSYGHMVVEDFTTNDDYGVRERNLSGRILRGAVSLDPSIEEGVRQYLQIGNENIDPILRWEQEGYLLELKNLIPSTQPS